MTTILLVRPIENDALIQRSQIGPLWLSKVPFTSMDVNFPVDCIGYRSGGGREIIQRFFLFQLQLAVRRRGGSDGWAL
jgi:hypothetical protein